MKFVLRTVGALVLLVALIYGVLAVFFAWSQNYTIGKEDSIEIGDSIQEVEGKKGLLRSKEVGLDEVNPAYHSEEWVSVIRNDGGTLRSYCFLGPNSSLPSGFVVVFDGEGKVFVVIPTDT